MKYRLATMAAALIACASSTAQAVDSSASLKLSNLTFTAIDLVPGDAQLPSYELLPNNAVSRATISRRANESATSQTAQGLFAPVSLTLNGDPNVTASALVTTTGFEVAVTGTGVFDKVLATASGSDSVSFASRQIRLAPGTGIAITGQYDISLNSVCPFAHPLCQATVGLNAQLLGTGWDSFDNGTFFSKSLSISGESRTLSGVAGTTYLNFTDQSVDLNFSFYGTVAIASVPEPAVMGLMAAGFCTVAATRRRRAKQARA